MKYSLVVREDEESKHIADYLKRNLVSLKYVTENPDIVIAIGGDGTVVRAFHDYQADDPYFVCIGTGTLGFYADWDKEEVDELITYLTAQMTPHVCYPLLDVTLYLEDGETVTLVGLNELVVKSNNTSTFVMNTYLNGDLFQSFRGDGMVFATPSGSTGYNHSLMGSVVHPSLECVQMTELAAINNQVYRTLNRPLLLPKHHCLVGEVQSDCEQVVAGLDGCFQFNGNVRRFQVRVSERSVKFLRYREFAFWTRVKEKFL